ncbi:hypothetical protein [Corynebacterium renale]|uniref:hypothetical protein n=1 Tax=Corynebacterium renale TaxID=1724 RepID=UPI000652D902|nr:hypothetical protein [Corynebacterium renale]
MMVETYTAAEICAHLGIGRHKLRTKLQKGEITKIDHGVYVEGSLKATDVAMALFQTHPNWILSGRSAYQMYLRQPLTLPVYFRSPRPQTNRVAEHFVVTSHRNHVVSIVNGIRMATPVLTAWDLRNEISEAEVVNSLETAYGKKTGKQKLEQDLSSMGTIPTQLRELLHTASIGADSQLEKRFYKALKGRGFEFEQNVLVGPYFWDFQSKRFKGLLIEIGAYQFHSELDTVEGQNSYIREVWKMNYAAYEGYVVLQFTAKCIDEELDACLDLVADTLKKLEGKAARRVWVPPWKWHMWIFKTVGFC